MDRIRYICLVLSLALIGDRFASALSDQCNKSCSLPECNCNPLAIPRNYSKAQTPQMITFTFSGPVTKEARKLLTEVFPVTVRNPNGCPASITLFVLEQYTKFCEVHKLYVRGHEIAVQGYNGTYSEKWTTSQWRKTAADLKAFLESEKYVPVDTIKGMRAYLQQPGGDEQFDMLDQSGFSWDSTLLGGPVDIDEESHWPTTLSFAMKPEDCLNRGICPQKAYPDLWKVPLLQLASDDLPCTYLDACVTQQQLGELETTNQIFNLLTRNFERSYNKNRAPFQVNIRVQSLTDPVQKEALKQFIQRLLCYDDTWIVSVSEMLAWMQNPVTNDLAKQYLVWECPDREYNTACSESGSKTPQSAKKTNANLGEMIDPQTIVIVQYVLFGVSYIVIVAYDRNAHND